jgi:hypothetical protein
LPVLLGDTPRLRTSTILEEDEFLGVRRTTPESTYSEYDCLRHPEGFYFLRNGRLFDLATNRVGGQRRHIYTLSNPLVRAEWERYKTEEATIKCIGNDEDVLRRALRRVNVLTSAPPQEAWVDGRTVDSLRHDLRAKLVALSLRDLQTLLLDVLPRSPEPKAA